MKMARWNLDADFDLILDRTAALWPSLRGGSFFVTGGTGFFGQWILETLRRANQRHQLGLRVCVLTRDPQGFERKAPALFADPSMHFVAGDVKDFTFPQSEFSHVIHAATTSAHETFGGEGPLAKFDTLVVGTRRVLDFAAVCGVTNLLFTSSGVVYHHPTVTEDGEFEPVSESCLMAPPTCDPNTALGQAKRVAEFLCATYAQKHEWHLGVARCFSFVGPYLPLDIHYAIGNFIDQALRAEQITVKGDGKALRSYLYAGDLVVWLLTLLTGGQSGLAYNVGSDRSLSIAELAVMVGNLVSPGKHVEILGTPWRTIGNPVRNVYVPDITLAKQLGLDVWTDLATAIQRTAEYERARHD